MHLLKTILKTTSRIPYWNFTFSDPKGVKTAQLIINNPELSDNGIITILSPYISTIAILLSIGGIILSVMIISKQKNQNSKIISVVAVLIYGGLFLFTLPAWRGFY